MQNALCEHVNESHNPAQENWRDLTINAIKAEQMNVILNFKN